MTLLAALIAAVAFDGEAARTHGARLAALGPHPWGSPRAAVAAQYVLSQFQRVGLQGVRLQEFENDGIAGVNVIGVLPGPGREVVLIGAHHDSPPDSPGAYDDGGGVGILIETARVLAAAPGRSRTLVFASFEGEEIWAKTRGSAMGSRAYVRSLGADARNLVAAVIVEMSGWKEGRPTVQNLAHPDPLRKGRYVITPAWLMQAILDGSKQSGHRFAVGDPLIPWLYQPAVRTFRSTQYTDTMAFLQAGRGAAFFTDSSFTRFYPHFHRPEDTADKLDAASLARLGRGVVGVVRTLAEVKAGSPQDLHWFAAFGHVFGAMTLYVVGALAAVLALRPPLRSKGSLLALRLFAVLGFAWLLWRNPVPALWMFLPPLVAVAFSARRRWIGLAFIPAIALAVLGGLAWQRSFVSGTFFETWELALMGLVAAALVLGGAPPRRGSGARRRAAPGRKGRRRRLAASLLTDNRREKREP